MSKNNLDDANPYTAGWTRPKMMKTLQETLPYLADDELQLIASQINVIQKQRALVQQSKAMLLHPHELHGPGPDEEK